MQTQENNVTSSPLARRIDMSVAVAEIDRDVESRLKRLAKTVKMSGFRPGKVPFKLVAQQYGHQVRSEAIGDAVQKSFGDAVREQKLRVAGYPQIEARPGGDAATLEFSAVFEVYPEFQLGDLSARVIERPTLEVGEAELDRTIEVLRKQRTSYMAVERSAADGDRVVVDFTGRIDGEIFQGGQATDFPIVLGSGAMLADFESQVLGMSAGQTRAFDLVFPADYHAAELAGKTAQFEVAIKSVEEARLPDVDAEFARALGIADGDLAKMRAEVRNNVEREVTKRLRARVKDQAMNALVEANPIDVPGALVDEEAQQMANSAMQDLANRGVDPKNVGVEPSWFRDQAVRRVKLGLILAELVRVHDLHAKPEQVRAMVEDLAQSYEDPQEVVRWYYGQRQQLAQIEALAIEENVVTWLLGQAQVIDKPVAFDELMGSAA